MVLYYPLTKKEFKVLISILETGTLEKDPSYNNKYKINKDQYLVEKEWGSNKYKVNDVKMGFWASRAILKALKRNMLKANILTNIGQVLYGSNR